MSGYLWEFCLSGTLTADVGPVDGRCRAHWRQTSGYLWEFCLSGPLTADVGPADGRRRARRRQTSGSLWEFCLSGLLTADVGPVDGRCWATFGNFVCLACWRQTSARQWQTSGPSTADVGLHLGILSVWPVDGRRRARQRQTIICRRLAPDERRCRFCRGPYFNSTVKYECLNSFFLRNVCIRHLPEHV